MSDNPFLPIIGELQKRQHLTHTVPLPAIRALNFRPKPIELGTYIVFSRSSRPPSASGEEQKPDTAVAAVPPPRRHVGLVVNTRALGAGQRLALPIAGPTNATADGHAGLKDTSAHAYMDAETKDVLRVDPDGQHFPWDGCIQWTTCERTARLRVVTQHECSGVRRGRAGRCRLTNESVLRFAEAAEEGCEHEPHSEKVEDDVADIVPVEVWFDLRITDVIHDAWE
ncbi:hypothetical protein BGW80DRAFT_1273103 [Lactifluus volemus]|nr:hypothetical protein BGW80DRAFT_1273103 [Lactifluus volemus]